MGAILNKLNQSKNVKIQIIKQMVRKSFLIIFILFSFILIFVGKPDSFIINKTSGIVVQVMSPIISLISYPIYAVGSFANDISNFRKVNKQNLELKREISNLNEEINYYKKIEAENIQLRRITNFVSGGTNYMLSTKVLGSSGGAFAHSFILDAGSKDGIEKYHGVLVDGCLVGQIISVGRNYSRMLLITDATLKIPVQIERTGTRAFLNGDNTKYPKLIHFENQDPVQIGDRVITSGMGGNLPYGIPVGIIGSISEEDGIVLQPYVDNSHIDYVKVIKTSHTEDIKKFLKENPILD